MISLFGLLFGFLLLIKGADFFVIGSSCIASKLGIPSILIGLTLVAFATSTPELVVSIIASINNSNEIVIGNVLGSNIFNILVVLGMSAMFTPVVISKQLLFKEYLWCTLATIFVCICMYTNYNLTQIEGILCITIFIMIISIQIYQSLKVKEIESLLIEHTISYTKAISYTTIGFTCILIGAQLSVHYACELAYMFHISETVVGLTIIAIGTSLPELVTSLIASKKGENNIAIGNIIGSNTFNILFILGTSSAINPISIQYSGVIDIVIFIIINIILLAILNKYKINKLFGILMVCSYLLYTLFIIYR